MLSAAEVTDGLGVTYDGIALHPFSPEFAAESYAHTTSTLTRFMAWERTASAAEFEPIWRGWMQGRSAGTDFVFAVVDAGTGDFLGQVGVHHAHEPISELGIWIREDRHGRGFGAKAVAAARDWATEHLPGVEGFRYPVAEQNTASRRIAESLGGVVVDSYPTDKFPVVVYRIPVDA
ncbi:GNAT family N-acetyltransferase [Gordonia asplenii]|uniref:GNAT family N-acetyltransferase n=1 Tax=Gordonia asplenii TaxID=2725283 RepID=UPI0028A97CA5|nr:GNAT family N-acetyltransferase [Gordonia asplenii]